MPRIKTREAKLNKAVEYATKYEPQVLDWIQQAEIRFPVDPAFDPLRRALEGFKKAVWVARQLDDALPLPGLAEVFDGPILLLIVSIVYGIHSAEIKRERKQAEKAPEPAPAPLAVEPQPLPVPVKAKAVKAKKAAAPKKASTKKPSPPKRAKRASKKAKSKKD